MLRDGEKVLQQEISCFENEVYENDLLIKADGSYERRWFDVPTVEDWRGGKELDKEPFIKTGDTHEIESNSNLCSIVPNPWR